MKILNTWWRRRSLVAAASAVALVVPLTLLAGSQATAGTNLVINPGFETVGIERLPDLLGEVRLGRQRLHSFTSPDRPLRYQGHAGHA